MITVGVYEAKTTLSKLLKRVSAGEAVTITSGRKPVARLMSLDPSGHIVERRPGNLKKLKQLSAPRPSRHAKPSGRSVIELIDEGRNERFDKLFR